MHNYHYIIASLPDLVADFSLKEFSYDKFSTMIKENLSERDRRIVAWFEYGLTPANLSRHFYREIGKLKCKFLSDYFAFDRNLRNLQVEFLASADQEKGDRYKVGETDRSIKELPEIRSILENKNIIEREAQMDKLKWDKINEMIQGHYFDMDVILAFLAKGVILRRWSSLDRERGAVLFEQFVTEVRGTFKGIDF